MITLPKAIYSLESHGHGKMPSSIFLLKEHIHKITSKDIPMDQGLAQAISEKLLLTVDGN